MTDIIYNGLQTPDGTVIESVHRHDYQTHTDANGKEYVIDGGFDYVRRSNHGDEKLLTVTIDDDHETVREHMKWGTRGPKGDQPLKYVKLKDMDTDHIQACIDTQKQMRPQIRTAMLNELDYRAKLV
jgi:hypothetical protein